MRRNARVVAALAAATALLLTACDPPPGDESRPPEPTDAPANWDAEVTWEPCPDLPREALSRELPTQVLPGLLREALNELAAAVMTAGRTYECGTLPVPQDWADPEGDTFDLALVRVRTGEPDREGRIGSLVINPGGPGGSGLDAATFLGMLPLVGGLPSEVTDHFDIVGFDPRGVGQSTPVDCFSDADLDEAFGADPDPQSQEDFDAVVAATERRVGQCETAHGDALQHFSTRQTAHDMDAIRRAVGDEQLTYLGYSYGTLLGAVYAHMYPGNIRAFVLDGAIDPSGGSGGNQALGFERAFDNFGAWCESSPGECQLEPDARTVVMEALDNARVDPVPGADGRSATPGWIFYAVLSTLYNDMLWPSLASALADLEAGDPSGVFTLADMYAGRDENGAYANMFDANTAINCADREERPSVEEIRGAQEQLRGEYPLFGGPLAVLGLDCALWPGEADPFPFGAAEGAPPILVIGTTGDPATPYEATAGLADLLGTGVVVTYEGEGHTVYPEDGCINDVVHSYLVDLAAPDQEVTCTAGEG